MPTPYWTILPVIHSTTTRAEKSYEDRRSKRLLTNVIKGTTPHGIVKGERGADKSMAHCPTVVAGDKQDFYG